MMGGRDVVAVGPLMAPAATPEAALPKTTHGSIPAALAKSLGFFCFSLFFLFPLEPQWAFYEETLIVVAILC